MPVTTRTESEIDWRAIGRGALVGFAVIVPVTIVNAVLHHEIAEFDDSGWRTPLYVLILVGYALAGWVAGRAQPESPLTHGTLAGFGALTMWIPARVVIWAVREDERGLVSGKDAALPPGQVFGAIVVAAALGMLGALLAARAQRRSSPDPD